MKKKKTLAKSIFSAQITSTISVALVLLILGLVAMMGIAARSITTEIKENMGFDLLLAEDATQDDVDRLIASLNSSPRVSSATLFSARQAMDQWKADTGEDVMELLGVNPFTGEIEVKVRAEYASSDSISAFVADLRANPIVADATVHAEMVDSINRNISSVGLILLIIAAALLLISFVLINNTVRLTVYSRRFTIHTMKLVGATASFIRRPFLVANLIHGILAAVIAIILLAALSTYIASLDPAVMQAVSLTDSLYVYGGILIAGIVICTLAAFFATNRYLRISYDKLFH